MRPEKSSSISPVNNPERQGIGGKLASLAPGGAEETAVDVISDAGPLDIIVQTLIETVMAGNVVLLAAFFV